MIKRILIAVASVITAIYLVNGLISNVWMYFSPARYMNLAQSFLGKFYWYNGSLLGLLSMLVILVAAGIFYLSLREIYWGKDDAQVDRSQKYAIWILGILGSFAFLKIGVFLKTDFSRFAQYVAIDGFVHGDRVVLQSSGELTYDPLIGFVIDVLNVATFEFGIAAVLLLMYAATKRIKARSSHLISIGVIGTVVLLRGINYLHQGSIFAVAYFIPMGVFAAVYLLKYGRIWPIVAGHAFFMVISLMGEAYDGQYMESMLKSGVSPLLLLAATGFLAIKVLDVKPSLKKNTII